MARLAIFAALVITYCGLSTGCCCCSDFMKGFNEGFQKGIKKAQEEQEAERRRQEEAAKKAAEQNKTTDKIAKGTFEYTVRSGQFMRDGQALAVGSSGTGAARNNPAMSNQPKTGPIPGGEWRVTNVRKDPKGGEPIIDIQFTTGPAPGRAGENFTVHPENTPTSGESGIAAPRHLRDMMQRDNVIRVDAK
jgi:hypothetical protein